MTEEPWSPPDRRYRKKYTIDGGVCDCPFCFGYQGMKRAGRFFICFQCNLRVPVKGPKIHLRYRSQNSLLIGERETHTSACGVIVSSRAPYKLGRFTSDISRVTCLKCIRTDHYHWRRHDEEVQ
jgi:hypothetical protein